MIFPSKGLVDSDLLVYRVGWTTEDVEEPLAAHRLSEMVRGMEEALKITNLQHFLSPLNKSNFRYRIFPEYKANRKQPKPKNFQFLRDTLQGVYGATIEDGIEADDALGIAQDKTGDTTVICTIDKDMDMIPGWHYNFVKGTLYHVSQKAAARTFYEQLLIGDKSTDNIEGCPGIGPVKAQRSLEGCENDLAMLIQCARMYRSAKPEDWLDSMWLAGQLLWIRQKVGQGWVLSSGEVVSKQSLAIFLQREGLTGGMSLEQSSTLSPSPSTDTHRTLK